ncbi:MAG: tRNA uridine-5-carboxymethylaminomethyl(34) synthesis GTPase MnmE [Bacilli bacterium]|nr:tRNA uridine-5-carboxymethylaminomethyl(34) synthesis GTPase MnmE [Bacilli bacterium]
MNDTIAAISTTMGVGAISIIRVSGNEAINIVNRIFKGKDLNIVDSHTINYGHIVENKNIIDEVLVSIMKAPRTFTREDIVEINTHGGIAITNKVLELLLLNGCRLAEPGEFTKRAFLNGRIDLIEAEGVMELINSKTEKSRKLAINQVNGEVSKLIKDLRQKVIEILANIEVNIDYPEYEDIEEMTNSMILSNIDDIEKEIKNILSHSENSKLIKDGIKTIIIGSPNVGKSSILNRLLNEEKAIVTDIAGTTRDIVEGNIQIDGIVLNMIDTAGIRETDDLVESIGVKKSLDLINEADLILYVLNNNEDLTKEEQEILDRIKYKNNIIIVNKTDLKNKLNLTLLPNYIEMSVKNDIGINELRNKIKEIFNLEKIEQNDYTYLSSARSISLLKKSLESLDAVRTGIENNMPIDMVEIDLKQMWSTLGEIIGETYTDELIDQLFSQFCLGK